MLKHKKIVSFIVFTTFIILGFSGCSGSKGVQTEGGDNSGIDRSLLSISAPKFNYSPFEYPTDVETDIRQFGIYNIDCGCDNYHIGWDFSPDWDSYPSGLVPIIAVADGIVETVNFKYQNTSGSQTVDTYSVVLAVAQEVNVYYTLEPFITLGETQAAEWINVSVGDEVSAGDTIAYLAKVEGNQNDDYVHLDFKIGIGESLNDFVCPTSYFSNEWQQENVDILLSKSNGCLSICCSQ